MESETVSSNGEFAEFEGKTAQKIRVSDHIITGLQSKNHPADSFVVEMERFSHLTQKPNSRITVSSPSPFDFMAITNFQLIYYHLLYILLIYIISRYILYS